VRVDNKHFDEALGDYNECISLMKVDGEDSSGLGKYPEYPDAFVGRALAYEGLAEWALALQDYNKAISLWGGIDDVSPVGAEPSTKVGLGINPYVLSFRGNVLTRLVSLSDSIHLFLLLMHCLSDKYYSSVLDGRTATKKLCWTMSARATSSSKTGEISLDTQTHVQTMR